MRFRFLGTGTSAGVPAIACHCPVCTSTDPRDTRLRTSACVRWTDTTGADRVVLLDCGPDLRAQALAMDLERLDAIVLTHNHVDHTWGLDEVRRFNAVMGTAIDLYAERHTLDFLARVYQHIFDRQRNINDSFVASLIAHELAPDRPLDLWGVRFTPLRLLHGRLPVLGYRIEPIDPDQARGTDPWWPLAYCTDVSAIPPETWPALTGLRTLVLDALRVRHHPTHLTIDQAVEIADRVGADRTWFVHMSHDLPHAATNESLPKAMALAYDGLELGGLGPGADQGQHKPSDSS